MRPVSKRVMYLTDELWKKIEPLVFKKPVGRNGGRPRADDRTGLSTQIGATCEHNQPLSFTRLSPESKGSFCQNT